MGIVKIPITIININGTKKKKVIAIADTGATTTIIPESLAKELKIEIIGRTSIKTTNGLTTRNYGSAYIVLNNQYELFRVIMYSGNKVILGVTVLEVLGYSINPITKMLKKENIIEY